MSSTRSRVEVLQELKAAQARVDELQLELDSLSSPPPRDDKEVKLEMEEYKRYSRQLILPSIGLPGQIKLKRAHILVVGAGGLGCPVLLYLAAAGVGETTVLDGDTVEVSNLHRQVLHAESRVGWPKCDSARVGMMAINSSVKVNAHNLRFSPALFQATDDTPKSILEPTFDLILDCTDNPSTRHFLNSYSSHHRIPLVSGGAVRTDGTVGVFNVPDPKTKGEMGPCYSCVFPHVAPKLDATPEEVALMGSGNCEDEGVLGVLCGVVGLGMASEALRVLLGSGKPTLHLYSPLSSSAPYRTIKLRPRQPSCPTCSDSSKAFATFVKESAVDSCPVATRSREADHGVAAEALKEMLRSNDARREVKVVDTRSTTEFGICSIPGSINIPLRQILQDPNSIVQQLRRNSPSEESERQVNENVVFVCRRGNDSVLAAHAMRSAGLEGVRDLVGGLENGWAQLDEEKSVFPVY